MSWLKSKYIRKVSMVNAYYHMPLKVAYQLSEFFFQIGSLLRNRFIP